MNFLEGEEENPLFSCDGKSDGAALGPQMQLKDLTPLESPAAGAGGSICRGDRLGQGHPNPPSARTTGVASPMVKVGNTMWALVAVAKYSAVCSPAHLGVQKCSCCDHCQGSRFRSSRTWRCTCAVGLTSQEVVGAVCC